MLYTVLLLHLKENWLHRCNQFRVSDLNSWTGYMHVISLSFRYCTALYSMQRSTVHWFTEVSNAVHTNESLYVWSTVHRFTEVFIAVHTETYNDNKRCAVCTVVVDVPYIDVLYGIHRFTEVPNVMRRIWRFSIQYTVLHCTVSKRRTDYIRVISLTLRLKKMNWLHTCNQFVF